MKTLYINIFIALFFLIQSCSEEKNSLITFETLLNELTTRDHLARYPDKQWFLYQASSYDRASVSPDREGWYANADWNHFFRVEENEGRKESVMLDVDGPGVVTRIWIAGNPNLKAALRFYIDGEKTPVWEAERAGVLIGENHDIGRPLSSRSVEQDELTNGRPGHNLYAPVPFAKHIKITYEAQEERPRAGNGMFYNINYRLYQDPVKIESLDTSTPTRYATVLKETNTQLSDFMDLSPKDVKMPEEKKVYSDVFTLNAGKSGTMNLKGGASIRRILLSFDSGDMDQTVRDVWIRLSFDGQTLVEVPVGFFFGCGNQLVASSDWYRKVDIFGNMACFWVMPYKNNASVALINKGTQPVSSLLTVATGNWKWDNHSMYFHCKYFQNDQVETEARKGEDFNFITIPSSAGVYVGDIFQISKQIGGWWGEGDEKIYIDGSNFPDHFGTGTEDYYGYAWGHAETFSHPFVGQPVGNANLTKEGGTTVNSRLRALDAIPFSKSLKFDMESWNWHGGTIDRAWACFWYEKSVK